MGEPGLKIPETPAKTKEKVRKQLKKRQESAVRRKLGFVNGDVVPGERPRKKHSTARSSPTP